MDALLKGLQKSFEKSGVTANEIILQKCVELCKKYNILNAEDFVNDWIAYSVTKLSGQNPTITLLNKFEKDEYIKKGRERNCSQYERKKSSLVIYGANSMEHDLNSILNITKLYEENSLKGKHVSETGSPENRSRSRDSQQVHFSPASFSPTITYPSPKYASRKNSGKVVFPYSNREFASNRMQSAITKIKKISCMNIQRYMNFDLIDALILADDAIAKLGSDIIRKFDLEDPMPVRYKHPFPFITFGRIACDSDGRLNAKSVVLEGSTELSKGEAIPLGLGNVEDKYSLFPGQVIAVQGINITGDMLMAKKIFSDASLEASPSGRPLEPLKIVAAAGPFTPSDSMTYQPLQDLIETVSSSLPDILILTGPFLDSSHPMIIENSLAETHSELFGKIVDMIMKPLQSLKIQVIMISSYKDCNGNCVYPTEELTLTNKHYENLHLLPDPSIFEVGGVIIGVTSTDSLMHIGKEEISCPAYNTDRLSRLASHIISQRNFYPLMPAVGVPVDPSLMEFAKIKVKPHILILPSDLRYFIKNVSGCVVVNPERLAKGIIGGTYARLSLTSTGLDGEIVRI